MKKLATALLATGTLLSSVSSQALPELFTDPEDGMLDISRFLLEYKYGVMPVPIVVTEPAIGEGAGIAAVFFHDNDDEPMDPNANLDDMPPPSVSVALGLYTNKDSWVVGGGHLGHYKDDNLRTFTVLGQASLNLDFYGVGTDRDTAFAFNAKANILAQEVLFRLGNSHWFMGADYMYMSILNTFELGLPEIPSVELDSKNAGLSAVVMYDSLNNNITPSHGIKSKWEYGAFDEAVGGDFNYRKLAAKNQTHLPLGKHFNLGLRLDGEFTDGDVPFYSAPFIQLKGIPAMRYQALNVVTGEARLTWMVTPRWHLNTFAGGGWTAENASDLADAAPKNAYGAGVRYLAARMIGLSVGFDIAKGPEDEVFYLGFGRAF